MTHTRTALVVAALVAVPFTLASCGDDAPDSPIGAGTGSGQSGSAPVELVEGETAEVTAVDNSFSPEEAVVAAGTEVVWTNNGRNDHNIIPEDEDAEWRVEGTEFTPGDTASYRFVEPGTYRYYCSFHGTIDAGMPGVIVVE